MQSEISGKSEDPGCFTILTEEELFPSILFTLSILVLTQAMQVNTAKVNTDPVTHPMFTGCAITDSPRFYNKHENAINC